MITEDTITKGALLRSWIFLCALRQSMIICYRQSITLEAINESFVIGNMINQWLFVIGNQVHLEAIDESFVFSGLAGGYRPTEKSDPLPDRLYASLGRRKKTEGKCFSGLAPATPLRSACRRQRRSDRYKGVSVNGFTADYSYLDRGTFGVFPLTYFDLPKSAGAYLFVHNLSKIITFAAAPLVLTPFVRNQRKRRRLVRVLWRALLSPEIIHVHVHIYIYIYICIHIIYIYIYICMHTYSSYIHILIMCKVCEAVAQT